eukprot:Lankesteria_metandrocarpae@DN1872_c0_g1_i1.p1
MDFTNRVGHKTGSGAPASAQEVQIDRRERLRKLALETIDLSKDPYIMRNHLGQYECKLCLTLHTNEASYLSHTQGKKHQLNLSRRAAKEKSDSAFQPQPKKTTATTGVKIGRPGYRVTKMRNPMFNQKAILFEVEYPEIDDNCKPRHRVMSAWEQKVEQPDPQFQYLIFAAEPYESVCFKVPNLEVEKGPGKFYSGWDPETKTYSLQLHFRKREEKMLPALPQRPTSFLPIGVRW